jgi:DNA-binding response OmpR family regulator
MVFDKLIENKIREALDKGEFSNLPGRGQPLNLDDYFATPEEMRLAHSILKNANVVPEEVELLREIGAVGEKIESCTDKTERDRLRKQQDELTLKLNLLLEQRKRRSR